ncbi:MAG: MATE family efflux transporter [Acutalibacteraceae bacterium]
MVTDMTKGSPSKVLLAFSMPMLISSMFQQFYNMADSIIAGRFIGENALAATGASFPVTMLFVAIALGVNIGCSVVISQLFGAKKYRNMKLAINTSFVFALSLSVLLTVFGLLFCKQILWLLNTPQNIMADSQAYLNIYIMGLMFLFLYNICTGVFTALGDSKTPLYFLVASSLGNIAVNLLFVIVLNMGVAGLAWATFLSQGVSSLLAVIVLVSRIKKLGHSGKVRYFSFSMLRKISVIAVPSILQQSFISVGNLFIQGLINGFGSSAVAGYSAAIKLNTFALTSFTSLANGLSSFTAQNIGAGKTQRVKKGFRAGAIMGAAVAVLCSSLFLLFSTQLLGMFLESDSTVAMETGKMFLYIAAPFYLVIVIKLMADAVLRGGGAMIAFMISTFSDLVIRVALAFVLSAFMGTNGIWASWPIGWSVAAIMSVTFYLCGNWKKKLRIN